MAAAGGGVDVLEGVDLLDAADGAERRALVVLRVRALERVAGLQMLERVGVAAELVAGLAEREMQMDALLERQRVDASGEIEQDAQALAAVRGIAVDLREIAVIPDAARRDPDRLLERGARLVHMTELDQHRAEIAIGGLVVGLERDGAALRRRGLL